MAKKTKERIKSKYEEMFQKNLKCFLTDEEKSLYASEVATLIQQERELEDEKAARAAEFGSRIKAVKGLYREKAQRFRQGYEYREVDCYVEKDFETKRANTIRTDTAEVIAERPLTADELQRPIEDAINGGQDSGLVGE